MSVSRPESIESRLATFIAAELLDEPFPEGDPLAADAVDSLGLEQLVDYIEAEFGVAIGDGEMGRENFASVPTLAAFVESKRADIWGVARRDRL